MLPPLSDNQRGKRCSGEGEIDRRFLVKEEQYESASGCLATICSIVRVNANTAMQTPYESANCSYSLLLRLLLLQGKCTPVQSSTQQNS